MRRTYQPNKRHAKKTHGFRARMAAFGTPVIKSRRAKGRRVLAR